MITLKDALTECERIRKDLTNAQAKLSDVMRAIAAQPDTTDTGHRCPQCGVQLRGPLALAEHLHGSHAGPLPDHWAAAELAAGLPDPRDEPRQHAATGEPPLT